MLCQLTVANYNINNLIVSQSQGDTNRFTISGSGYTESIPIHISNNTDFTNQASVNFWDGNGSLSDPYIIEGLNITTIGDFSVNIGNTTVFFEVRGCLLGGGSTGVFLENVTNAKIWNNTVQNVDNYGLLISESDSIKVINNTVQNIIGADAAGLYSISSDFCELSNNTIDSVNGWSILVDYSNNCSISENIIGESLHDGIRLRDSSENNITLNVISSVTTGIKLGNSHRCIIEENLVEYSLSDGISIEASSSCTIEGNVLFESGAYSLDVSGDSSDIIANTFYKSQLQGLRCQSSNNNVEQNNFIENNLQYSEIISYLSVIGTNNNIEGNYYDVWTWPDDDVDYIVDKPYPYGDEQNDLEPHVKVFQTDLMHILTKPRLIYPNETLAGEKFWGLIHLNWSVSSDTFGHDATYNVSVSANGGSSWSGIAQGLIDTNLDWNSSEFLESVEYKFKILAQCADGLIAEYTTGVEFEVKSHTLSAPVILSPNGGETIVGTYDIRWEESVESWNLLVTYRISYSPDAGETWIDLIDFLESTSFTWDVRGLSEGNQYLIRIIANGASGLVAEDQSDSVFTISRENYTATIVLVASVAAMIVVITYLVRRRGTL